MAADTTNTNKPQNENNNDFGLPKGEFIPIESAGNNKWVKLTIIIAGVVLLIGAGVVFWLFYRSDNKKDFLSSTLQRYQIKEDGEDVKDEELMDSQQDNEDMDFDTPQEKEDASNKVDNKSKHLAHQGTKGDTYHAALQELDEITENLAASEEATSSAGKRADKGGTASITTVTAPQGIYYVVVASYIDIDLARDHAQQLVKKGVHVTLITPTKGQHFVRLAIAQAKTFKEATQQAEALRPEYGDHIWVVKY